MSEEYLTTDELAGRIKFGKQSLYNLIYKGQLQMGIHYLKPTPKKVLFVWSEIQKWMGQIPEMAPVPEIPRAVAVPQSNLDI